MVSPRESELLSNKSEGTIEDVKIVTPVRPGDRTIRLEHDMASTYYDTEQSVLKRKRFEDIEQDQDHDHPF